MIIDFLLDDIREAIADIQEDVSGLTETSFANVNYVSSAKTIYFYNVLGEELGTIDTTDFVVDGMIDTVTLSGNVLHFVFNTDSGKQPIDVDLSSVMPDLDEYWTSAETKTYVDTELGVLSGVVQEQQIVFSSGYNELHTQVMELSGRTVDLSGYYTSAQTDNKIAQVIADYTPTSGFSTINGSAITNGGNLIIEAGGDMSAYWTSAETKTYVDSAITAVQDQLDTIDAIVPAALVDLNTRKVESTSVHTIWKGTQADYDLIITKDPATFYIIVNN